MQHIQLEWWAKFQPIWLPTVLKPRNFGPDVAYWLELGLIYRQPESTYFRSKR